MRSTTWTAAISLAAVGVLLTACAPAQSVDAERPASSYTPAPTASEFPTGEPEPEEPTCLNIVSQETIDTLEAEGFILIDDYQDHLMSEHRVELMFFDNGGVDCVWGIAGGGDSLVSFGYSPISAADAEVAQQRLEENGYHRSESGGEVSYTIDPSNDLLSMGDVFLFTDGEWFHSTSLEAIDEMRAHLG
jgi:hypothetical protein